MDNRKAEFIEQFHAKVDHGLGELVKTLSAPVEEEDKAAAFAVLQAVFIKGAAFMAKMSGMTEMLFLAGCQMGYQTTDVRRNHASEN